jgi:hypothetical protein
VGWFRVKDSTVNSAHTARLAAGEYLVLALRSLEEANDWLAREDTPENARAKHLNDLMIERIEWITA